MALTHEQWAAIGTWVAAIGTVGTLMAAAWATYETRQIADEARQDSLEVRREAAEVKRVEQASKVCGWELPHTMHGRFGRLGIRISNSSSEPVYEVVAYMVWVQGAAPHTGEETETHYRGRPLENDLHHIRAIVQVLPPGEFTVRLNGPSNSPMQGVLGVEIAFTDGAGRHWVRRVPRGQLEVLEMEPIQHYGISRPLHYNDLETWTGE